MLSGRSAGTGAHRLHLAAPGPGDRAGPALAPGPGSSAYQQSQYEHAMTHWRGEVEAGRRAVAARTRTTTQGWARSLPLPSGAGRVPAGGLRQPGGRLLARCRRRVRTRQSGGHHVSRRRGSCCWPSAEAQRDTPAGELDGDDVIALTSYLPSAAAASAAQLDLLAAGASFAAVLGPEITPAQLGHLVSESLSGRVVSEVRSGQALFANNSAALRPAAARVLAPIITDLRRPGASGVVNGFASAPGGRQHNQILSQHRASAVALYLEARGIPRSSLVVVGHGASNLVGPGFSGANRRVVVVIEEPTGGGDLTDAPRAQPRARHHVTFSARNGSSASESGWPVPWPTGRVVPTRTSTPGYMATSRAAARYTRSRSPAAAHSSAQRPQATAASLVHSASASRKVCRPAPEGRIGPAHRPPHVAQLRTDHGAARVVHDLHPGFVRRPPFPDLGPDPRVPQVAEGRRRPGRSGWRDPRAGRGTGRAHAGRHPAPASPRRSGGTARAGPSAQHRATAHAGRSRPGSAAGRGPSATAPGHHRAGGLRGGVRQA